MHLPSDLDTYLWISWLLNPDAHRVLGVTYLAIQIFDDFNINDSDSETEQSAHGQRLCCLRKVPVLTALLVGAHSDLLMDSAGAACVRCPS